MEVPISDLAVVPNPDILDELVYPTLGMLPFVRKTSGSPAGHHSELLQALHGLANTVRRI
jgi:hypothetical protein